MANSTTDAGDGVERTQVGAGGVPTLVFDGACGFCTASSRWIAGRWSGPGRALPYQELDRAELARLGLSPSQVGDAAWWVDEDGTAWSGHDAIARSLAAGRGWRRTLGRVLLRPPLRRLGSVAYPVVARHRRRLPGSDPVCRPQGGCEV
ncbi:MAG TPA: DUF393 domain-containing protein [Acidimicrobiales bacterium]|nr:DUF393 domain-containing protein [Acidimicrobiales bacterium]